MATNVEALIRNLGNTYRDVFDAGLIPYKTEPTSSPGESSVNLDMAKEGIFLSFKRDGRIFKEMTLRIQNHKIKDWVFPNKLPAPLQVSMSRQWIHDHLGEPERSSPPEVFMKRAFGWIELYRFGYFQPPISMQVSYDMDEKVKSITFLLSSELRW